MNKQQIRELMKDKFVEIKGDEYYNTFGEGYACLNANENGELVLLYFKPIPEKPSEPVYPVVFEDEYCKIIVNQDGYINIQHNNITFGFSQYNSLPLLEKAIDKSREIRGVK